MKKFYILALVAAMFAACATDATEDVAIGVPETLRVSFEDEDSRIQLANGKTVWTKGDQVSVFYRSNANQKWQYKGETGERVGELQQVDAGSATREMDRVVVVYPYNESYYINPSTCNVQASLPAVQAYLADSYGLNGNIMVSHGEYNNISLKSVCGWLKLQLTGNGEKVQTITLKGNNGEQVAGEIYINSADATAILSSDAGDADDSEIGGAGGNLLFENTILNEVTLNCGEGVTLSAEPTAFYIALPPQEFSKGLTVEINCKGYKPMSLNTSNIITIERNHIQPMSSVKFEAEVRTIANNEIWYVATQKINDPSWSFDTFGANIVSNEWNSITGEGIISFDDDVTTIGIRAFYRCDKLKGIILNKSIKSIRNYAFEGCTSLTEITIPANVDSIGCSFVDCTSLSSVVFENGESQIRIYYGAFDGVAAALYVDRDIEGHVLSGPFENAKITAITIGPNMQHINDSVFSYCRELQSLIFEEESQVETIGQYAFAASNITGTVHIPESVVEIDPAAFALTTGISNFRSKSPYYHEGVYGELKSGQTTLFRYPSSAHYDGFISSSQYDKIGSWSFSGGDIKRVYLSLDEVIEIGDYAFWRCNDLTEFKSYGGGAKMLISSIGDSAFGDTAVEELNFLDSTFASINATFRMCEALHTLYLPATLTEIGEMSFHDCCSLTSLYIAATTPPTLSCDAFNIVAEGLLIYVPAESVNSYKRAEGWKEFADCIVGYDFENGVVVSGQPNNEIWYTSSDDAVVEPYDSDVFGATVVSNTYENGKGIITFDTPVTLIGRAAFFRCHSLTSVTIPDSVTSIGISAFKDCNSLTSITIPDGVAEIGGSAFYGCTSLKEVYCKPTTPPTGGELMFSYYKRSDHYDIGCKIYVPRASVSAYKAASYWNKYKSYIEPYDFE